VQGPLTIVKLLILALAGLAALVLLAGQAGWLGGSPPKKLGVKDGRLAPPSRTPNSVSSQAASWPGEMSEAARIDPLPGRGSAAATMPRLRALVEAMPGAAVIEAREDYLYVQFTTRWLKFVDDAEFWFDPAANLVQVRSASRVGRKDFGVNRARIESIRARLAAS
jgi:uncharacterized protein (DUF1499 family)